MTKCLEAFCECESDETLKGSGMESGAICILKQLSGNMDMEKLA